MDPTISPNPAGTLDPEAFYDELAPSYDVMTGFNDRFAREQPVFQRIVNAHGVRTAIDAGAGSGFHALLLAQLGVRVTAVDISEKMLALVQHHAQEMHLQIESARGRFQDLAQIIQQRVDGVFCLGNSLAHLLDDTASEQAIRSFAAVLRPGGILILQMLNYARILSSRDRIVGAQQRGDTMFVRFYDFLDPLVQFNILTVRQQGAGWKSELKSTMLRPFSADQLQQQLHAAEFRNINFFGGLSSEAYLPGKSRDLVVIAQKQ